MELSVLLLEKTVTLAIMILMGFISVRTGHVKSEHSSVLSKLCFDWVIPCSVFGSFLIGYDSGIARDFCFSLAATAVTVLSLIAVTLLLKRPLRLDPSAQGSLMFANSAGMALPLASSLIGQRGVLFCAPQMGIQNLLIFTWLPRVMSDNAERSLKKIILNRNILAILAGFVLFKLNEKGFISGNLSHWVTTMTEHITGIKNSTEDFLHEEGYLLPTATVAPNQGQIANPTY